MNPDLGKVLTKKMNCQKCGSEMQVGFATDRTIGSLQATGWVEGEPKKAFWVGTALSEREVRPIVAHRCTGCSFVELYAPETAE